jgi:hypothetical protein
LKKTSALKFQYRKAWLRSWLNREPPFCVEVEKMFKDMLLNALVRGQKEENSNKETLQAIGKIQNQKRLSSDEFLKIYETIWKEGPKIKYQSPDSWSRRIEGF